MISCRCRLSCHQKFPKLPKFQKIQKIQIKFNQVWSSLDKFDQFWATLFNFDPFWTNLMISLNKFNSVWSSLNKCEPIWSIWIQFEQVWTSLDKFGQFNLIKFQQHVSNFRSKLKIAQNCSKFSKMSDNALEKLFLRTIIETSSRSKIGHTFRKWSTF